MVDFIKIKGKPVVQLPSLEWAQDVAFAMDIADHLNNLNRMLQGHNKVVTQYYDNRQAFRYKLALWEKQLSNNSPAHLPYLKDPYNAGTAEDLGQHKEKISNLFQQFEWHFLVFDEFETEFKIICSPLSVTPSHVPTDMQLETIDLQCDSNLKEKLASVGLKIYKYLLPGYPKLRDLAAKILLKFSTTYLD